MNTRIPPPPPPPPKRVLNLVPSRSTIGQFVLAPRIVLNPRLITGKSMAILGVNGSGKSGTARQLMEQHIEKGLDKYPFTMCDIENEYATLKELSGEILVAGLKGDATNSIKIDVVLSNSAEFHELGRKAFEERLTIVLLLNDLEDEIRSQYLTAYLNGIFEIANDPLKAHYYRVFIEEAQEYVPQTGGGPKTEDELRKTIMRFAKRGRKRKISLVIISQRPSNVDKNVLTQCHLLLLHYQTYPTDINIYESKTGFGIEGAKEIVQNMQTGDCIYIFGKHRVQDRINKPKTSSPWDEDSTFDPSLLKQVDQSVVSSVQETVIREGAKSDEGMSVVPTHYIHGLERFAEEAKEQIRGLVSTQIQLEDRISDLNNRVDETQSLGGKDKSELIADNVELTRQLNRAQAEALPVRLIRDLVAQQLPSS